MSKAPQIASQPTEPVQFVRSTEGFSDEAVPRAKAAQLKLENYYKLAVEAAVERNTRFVSSLLVLCLLHHLPPPYQ